MADLSLGRIASVVPEFAVKDLPFGRTLMIMIIYVYNVNNINIMDITLTNQDHGIN